MTDATDTRLADAGERPAGDLRPAAHVVLMFTMWRRLRPGCCFLMATALLLTVRLACSHFDPVPGEARFMPFYVLRPLVAILLGPAGVWASLASTILADLIAGPWASLAWFRAGGDFAAAMYVFVLWDSSFFRRRPTSPLAPGWPQTIRFIALSVSAGLVSVAWNAFGIHLHGSQPWREVALIEAAQILVFCPLLAPALFRAAARDIAAHLGDWHAASGQTNRDAHWRPVALVLGTAFAMASLIVLLAPVVAGTQLLAAILVAHLLILLWPG